MSLNPDQALSCSLIFSLLGSKLSSDPSHGSSPCQGSLKLHCVSSSLSALYSFQGAFPCCLSLRFIASRDSSFIISESYLRVNTFFEILFDFFVSFFGTPSKGVFPACRFFFLQQFQQSPSSVLSRASAPAVSCFKSASTPASSTAFAPIYSFSLGSVPEGRTQIHAPPTSE